MKAQGTTEFIILFMVLLFALSIVTTGCFSNVLSMSRTRAEMEASRVVYDASSKINSAFLEGPGFRTNLTLPQTILGANYSAVIEGRFVVIELTGPVYSRPLLTRNITGSLASGLNTVENAGGEIRISQP